jgi:hypothetical protein
MYVIADLNESMLHHLHMVSCRHATTMLLLHIMLLLQAD